MLQVEPETRSGEVLAFKTRDDQDAAAEGDVDDADEKASVNFRNIKDTFHISDECWHELAQIKSTKGIPTLNDIKKQ